MAADHLPFPQNTMSFQETAAIAHVGRCVMSCQADVLSYLHHTPRQYPINEHVNS